MRKVFTVGFIFLLIFENGESMKCYVCRSDEDNDCESTPDDSYLVECPTKGNVSSEYCRKISQKLKFRDEKSWTFIRECAYEKGEKDCYNYKWLTIGYQETCECEEEGCNRGCFYNVMTTTFVFTSVYNFLKNV